MAIYKVINESTAPEPEDALKEAFDYLNGCLEGSYEIDEELLEACIDVVNENTDVVTVDDYNTVMESVDYLHEISAKKLTKKLNKECDKTDPKAWAKGSKSHEAYGKEYGKELKKAIAASKEKNSGKYFDKDEVAEDKDRFKSMYKAYKKANKLADEGKYKKLGKHFYKNDMI